MDSLLVRSDSLQEFMDSLHSLIMDSLYLGQWSAHKRRRRFSFRQQLSMGSKQ
jgi:hypothetical protein